MDNNITRYCIIYAVLSQQTAERLNVGIITLGKDDVKYRYSQRKLDALKLLLPEKVHTFYSNLVKNLDVKQLASPDKLDYMQRYSNNLLAISPVRSVELPASTQTADYLFHSYVE